MSSTGGLFGRIALEKGLLAERDLLRALRAQEELRAFGLDRPLGEVLVADGALSPREVRRLLRLQRLNEGRARAKRFGRVAVRNGLIDEAQLSAALATARAEEFARPLGEVLVASGALSARAAAAIERALATRGPRAEAEPAQEESEHAPTIRLDMVAVLADAIADPEAETLRLDGVDPLPSVLVDDEGWREDLLFAAVALREGRVLIPELERALQEQRRHSRPPRLRDVLTERGVLSPAQAEALVRAVEDGRTERLRIPGYAVVDLLGQGSTSLVLRARHELLGREVAIKVLRHESEAGAARLLDEARLTASVQHPNLVTLYEVGQLQQRTYFVMELVDGPTLLAAIRERGPLPVQEVLRHARDVARALEALEAAGLVHRDVKPQNVLLAAGGAKLADLGLARRAEPSARDDARTIDGTPHTISPEQARGEALDARSDLYGLGATCFHALTGTPPFDGKSTLEILRRHLEEPVPDPRARRADVPKPVAALIRRLLAKRPADRPSGPGALAEELEALLG